MNKLSQETELLLNASTIRYYRYAAWVLALISMILAGFTADTVVQGIIVGGSVASGLAAIICAVTSLSLIIWSGMRDVIEAIEDDGLHSRWP